MPATEERKPKCSNRGCPSPEGSDGNPVKLFDIDVDSGLEIWLCQRCIDESIDRLVRKTVADLFGPEVA